MGKKFIGRVFGWECFSPNVRELLSTPLNRLDLRFIERKKLTTKEKHIHIPAAEVLN